VALNSLRFGRSAARVVAIAAAVSAFEALPAKADLVSITSASFSGNSTTSSFAPFDATLGTLNSVNVLINGTFNILTAPPAYLGPGNAPISYLFSVAASQSFTGLGGQGFTTLAAPAPFIGAALSDGTGAAVSVPIPFAYGFTLTAGSDLAGGTPSSQGGFIDGKRSDFIGILPIQEVITESAMFWTGTLPVAILVASADGNAQITYDYTPPAPVVAAVPEPASLGMFGAGLLAFIGLRRRQKKAA